MILYVQSREYSVCLSGFCIVRDSVVDLED